MVTACHRFMKTKPFPEAMTSFILSDTYMRKLCCNTLSVMLIMAFLLCFHELFNSSSNGVKTERIGIDFL